MRPVGSKAAFTFTLLDRPHLSVIGPFAGKQHYGKVQRGGRPQASPNPALRGCKTLGFVSRPTPSTGRITDRILFRKRIRRYDRLKLGAISWWDHFQLYFGKAGSSLDLAFTFSRSH